MSLQKRMDMLKEGGIVDAQGYADLEVISRIFWEEEGIELGEENAGVMITHMATAFYRARRGEEIEGPAPEIMEGVVQESLYPRAQELFAVIENRINNTLSLPEKEYFLIHICAVLIAARKR